MNCDDVFEVVLSGAALSEEMDGHIARCEECQSLRDAVIALDAAGENDRSRDVSRATVDAVLVGAREIRRLKDRPPHTHMAEWWLHRNLASVAATILVLGAGIVMIQRFLSDDDVSEVAVAVASASLSGDMDYAMTSAKQSVLGFQSRHGQRVVLAGMDADMSALRGRLALVSVGMEREFAGLK